MRHLTLSPITGLSLAALLACGQASLSSDTPATLASARAEHDAMLPFPTSEKTLGNGLKVIVVKTGFPNLVSLQIPVKTGSRNEVEPGKTGFAHFFEHMMFRGTKNYPPDKYQEIMTKAGARQNAYTTDDFTNYHVTFAKEDLDQILEIEGDRFQNLEYPLDAFQTEARAVLGEYNKNFANPIRKLFEVQRDAAFTTHTYKHTTMGFIQDIEAMPTQFEYSRVFFDRWYRPENATVMLVGDVEPEAVFAMVEKHFGAWKRGNFSVDIPQEPKHEKAAYVHHEWPSPTLPLLAVAFHGPKFSETVSDSAAMELLLNLWFGQTSELFDRLVNVEQKIDALDAGNAENEDPDLVNLLARAKDPKDVVYVRDQILATVARARVEPVDATKLAEAQSFLRYSFAASLTNNESVGALLARLVRHRRSAETVASLFRLYDSVTPEKILEVANRYLVDGNLIVTTISHEPLDAKVAQFPAIASLAPAAGGATKKPPTAAKSAGPPPVPAGAKPFPTDKVVGVKSTTPLIAFRLLFDAGSKDDPPGKEGLAELAARMIADSGSKWLTYAEIQQKLYPIAGSWSAQVDREMTVFRGSVHRDNLDAYVAIAIEQLLNPGLRDDDFKRNLEVQKNALLVDLRSNNEEELGKERLLADIFAGTRYAHPTSGTAAGLDSITLDDVKTFIRGHYTVAALTLGISGDVPAAALESLRTRIGAGLPAGAAGTAPKIAAKRSSGLTVDLIEKETRATAISLGQPIDVTRSHPDYPALYLARTFFGEHRSSLSWLYQRLRELRGMNYGDYAYIEAFPRGGSRFFPDPNVARRAQIFEIWIRPVPPEQAHFALRAALFELDKLIANGLTAEQFEATREYLMKNVFLLVDGQDRELGYRLDSRWYGTPEYATWMRERLSKLKLEDVNAALKRHLSPTDLHVVMVAKGTAQLRDALLADAPSPMKYASEMPADVLAEDQVIAARKLGLKPEQVTVTPVDQVFAR